MNNHYVAIVAFDTDKLDPEGNPKTKKSKFLIPGVTLFDAQNTLMDYLKSDSRGWDVKSITQFQVEDILAQKKGVTKIS